MLRPQVHDRIDDTAKDFKDTEEPKMIITIFDLAGMKKVTGTKLKAEELVTFIPKLGGKEYIFLLKHYHAIQKKLPACSGASLYPKTRHP